MVGWFGVVEFFASCCSWSTLIPWSFNDCGNDGWSDKCGLHVFVYSLTLGFECVEVRTTNVRCLVLVTKDSFFYPLSVDYVLFGVWFTDWDLLLSRGPPRRPPSQVLEQLKSLNQSLRLGHLLCRSRHPDFLLNIIQRQVSELSFVWR